VVIRGSAPYGGFVKIGDGGKDRRRIIMKRKIVLVSLFLIAGISLFAQSKETKAIVGRWYLPERGTVVEFTADGNMVVGGDGTYQYFVTETMVGSNYRTAWNYWMYTISSDGKVMIWGGSGAGWGFVKL
jgi:hypothetical protein